jgi:hypothetical protein
MRIDTRTSRRAAALLAAYALSLFPLGGCFDTPTSTRDTQDYPPLNGTPFDRDLPAAAALTTVLQKGDTVYFFGGRGADGGAVESVWAYVLGSRTWIARAPMPTARFYAGAVACGGFIYVIGGRDNTTSFEQSDRLQRVVERYDPARDEWTSLPPVTAAAFDGTYPNFFAAVRGRIYAISTLRTSRSTTLYESADGVTWTEHPLRIAVGTEPTLMTDGDDLLLMNGISEYLGHGLYRIDPVSKRAQYDAPAYPWLRGYANRWIELEGTVYDINGFEGESDVLAVYQGGSWGFNSVPYDITTNRHFVPIVVDRGLGTLYLFAPPQLRIGVHYSTMENRFFQK